ncbi:MAG TPA: diguanylate cyclase, partial [Coleofasciculaceae cyanobacterium]
MRQTLVRRGYQVKTHPGRSSVLDDLPAVDSDLGSRPDLLLLGPGLFQDSAAVWCQKLRQLGNEALLWIAVGNGNQPQQRIEVFRSGGADYLEHPLHVAEAIVRIERQLTLHLQRSELQTQVNRLQQEMLDYRRVELEMQLFLALTQAITEATEIEQAFHSVLDCVYRAIGWDYGEIWMPDVTGHHLILARSHYATSDPALQQFDHASQSLHFERDRGVVGRVWETGRPLWIEDATQMYDSFFVRQPLVLAAGLRANLSVPIVVNGQILAVLCLFHRVAIPFDGRLIKLMGAVAAQMGVLLQRKKVELDLRRANLQLEVLAKLDGLTQIPNRRCFDGYLLREWGRLAEHSQWIGVGLCDVDHFKQYNDAYGHQAGDECLIQVARALSAVMSESANLVARYGGEEFVVILSDTNPEQMEAIAQAIQAAIARLAIDHIKSSVSQHITLSMGFAIAQPHQPNSSPDDLLRLA